MSMDNDNPLEDNWENQLIEYTMGVMAPTETLEFERQLSECQAHVKLAGHYAQVVGWVGASVPPAEPPAGHKNRLMTRITSAPQEHTTLVSPVLTPMSPPATGAQPHNRPTLAAPVAVPVQSPPREASKPAYVTDLNEYRKKRDLSRNIAMISGLAAALVMLIGAVWLYSLLTKPYIPSGYTAVLLQPQNETVKGSIVAFVNPGKRDVLLLGSELEQLPATKVYELWVIPDGGTPQPAGIFTAAETGAARHEVQVASNVSEYGALAVTVEDAPGSSTPSTKPILVGKTTTQ